MTLTDRYIAAAVRGVPADQKADIEADIRSLILDTMEVHEGEVEDPEHLERIALEELGDPERLASTYLDRELALIGPRYYLQWKKYTFWLLVLVVPTIAIVSFIATIADSSSAWEAILDVIATAGTVGVQMVFWLTFAFFIADRYGKEPVEKWKVSDLPESYGPDFSTKGAIGEVLVLALAAGLAFWAGWVRPSVTSGGERHPVFHENFDSWVLYAFGIAVLVEMIVVIVRHLRGRYGLLDVIAAVVLNGAILAIALPPLLGHEVFSAAWSEGEIGSRFENFDLGQAHNLVGALFIAFAIWDVASTAYYWYKSKR